MIKRASHRLIVAITDNKKALSRATNTMRGQRKTKLLNYTTKTIPGENKLYSRGLWRGFGGQEITMNESLKNLADGLTTYVFNHTPEECQAFKERITAQLADDPGRAEFAADSTQHCIDRVHNVRYEVVG